MISKTISLGRGLLMALAISALGTSSALAQDASPAHLEAARAAIGALNATEQFDQILPNAATQIKAELIVNNPNLQSQISAMVDDNAIELASRRAALENEVARIYARIFTEQELREIAAFYNSAAGTKLIAQGAVAARDMMGAADIWANGIVRDLQAASVADMNVLAPPGETAAAPAQ